VTGTTTKEVTMKTKLLLCSALAAAALGAFGASVSGGADPARFTTRIDNPWFPLRSGTVYVYTGGKDGKPSRDLVTVTHRTITIAGVQCRVVRDLVYVDGRLAERTSDYYAQDRAGNVWYFGEDTAELDRQGRVTTTEGTWRAGVSGAKPGVLMPATPVLGKAYRQEFEKGHAEDFARAISVFRTVAGPRGSNGLLTEEWSPLEPGVLDHKMYVRGIGNVLERTVKGGNEYQELQSVRLGA
jgi:hypothetical protein